MGSKVIMYLCVEGLDLRAWGRDYTSTRKKERETLKDKTLEKEEKEVELV
jgi:hypothetical protein